MYPNVRAIFLIGRKENMSEDVKKQLKLEMNYYCDILQGISLSPLRWRAAVIKYKSLK